MTRPTARKETLRRKIQDGIDSQGWKLVGGPMGFLRGSSNGMLKPLIEYLERKGVEVK